MRRQSRRELRPDVHLNALALEHASNMCRWMQDPAVSHNIGLRSEPSMEKTVAWITNAIDDPSIRPFAVLVDDQHVGNVVLDRIDNYLTSARVSIYIGQAEAQHAGVGHSGLSLALLEGFDHLKLHKIWLTVHARNVAAINTYCGLGFKLEGILRDEFWLDDQRVDLLYMGLLESEFNLRVKGASS